MVSIRNGHGGSLVISNEKAKIAEEDWYTRMDLNNTASNGHVDTVAFDNKKPNQVDSEDWYTRMDHNHTSSDGRTVTFPDNDKANPVDNEDWYTRMDLDRTTKREGGYDQVDKSIRRRRNSGEKSIDEDPYYTPMDGKVAENADKNSVHAKKHATEEDYWYTRMDFNKSQETHGKNATTEAFVDKNKALSAEEDSYTAMDHNKTAQTITDNRDQEESMLSQSKRADEDSYGYVHMDSSAAQARQKTTLKNGNSKEKFLKEQGEKSVPIESKPEDNFVPNGHPLPEADMMIQKMKKPELVNSAQPTSSEIEEDEDDPYNYNFIPAQVQAMATH